MGGRAHALSNNLTVVSNLSKVFALNGADFVLDNDLNVWYIEAQEAPGLEEEFDFRVEMHRDLWRPLIMRVAEIQDKLEADPTKSVLPLNNLGKWEIIYAGSGVDQWGYEYRGYQRETNKPTCKLPPKTRSSIKSRNV